MQNSDSACSRARARARARAACPTWAYRVRTLPSDPNAGLVVQILVGFRFRFSLHEFSEPNPTRPTHTSVFSEPNPTRVLNHDEPALNLGTPYSRPGQCPGYGTPESDTSKRCQMLGSWVRQTVPRLYARTGARGARASRAARARHARPTRGLSPR